MLLGDWCRQEWANYENDRINALIWQLALGKSPSNPVSSFRSRPVWHYLALLLALGLVLSTWLLLTSGQRTHANAAPVPGPAPTATVPPTPTFTPSPTPDLPYQEGVKVIVKTFALTPAPATPVPTPGAVATVQSEWALAVEEARGLGGILVLVATAGPYLNLRTGPGTQHPRSGQITAGSPVLAVAWQPVATSGCTRGWLFVQSLPSQPQRDLPAAGGWACHQFLHDIENAAAELPGDPS